MSTQDNAPPSSTSSSSTTSLATTATAAPVVTPATSPAGSHPIAAYFPLVHRIVARFARRLPRSFPREDLVAAGMFGLLRAYESTSHTSEEMFASYAKIRIRGAVVDELRRQDWAPRRRRSAGTAPVVVGFDDLPPTTSLAHDDASPFDEVVSLRQTSALRHAMNRLSDREREVIGLRYFEEVPSRGVAERLGVSEARISQIHGRAVARLRELLATDLDAPAQDLAA